MECIETFCFDVKDRSKYKRIEIQFVRSKSIAEDTTILRKRETASEDCVEQNKVDRT